MIVKIFVVLTLHNFDIFITDGIENTPKNMETITKCQRGTKSMGPHGSCLKNDENTCKCVTVIQIYKMLSFYKIN